MANALYPAFKTRLLSPGADLVAGLLGAGAGTEPTMAPLKAVLVTTGGGAYEYDGAGHAFASALTGHIIGAPQAITGATVTAGALDADDVDFPDVAAGSTVGAIVLYLDTGDAATSPLVAYIDSRSFGGVEAALSVETNGRSILFRWSDALKILAL